MNNRDVAEEVSVVWPRRSEYIAGNPAMIEVFSFYMFIEN